MFQLKYYCAKNKKKTILLQFSWKYKQKRFYHSMVHSNEILFTPNADILVHVLLRIAKGTLYIKTLYNPNS